jgi:hypothetical protein
MEKTSYRLIDEILKAVNNRLMVGGFLTYNLYKEPLTMLTTAVYALPM